MRWIGMFIFFGVLLTPGISQDQKQQLKSGDRAYLRDQFDKAEGSYREAERIKPDYASTYNLGNALYQQEKMEEAQNRFDAALGKANDPAEKAQAYYNLGNSYAKQNKLKEAIGAYKQSLKFKPGDPAASHNLAQAMVRAQAPPPQQQEQQSGDNEDENQDQEQQEQQEEQDQKDEQKENQDQQQEQKEQQEEQGEGEKQGQENPSESKAGEAGELTEEEAERLLKIMEEQEKKTWEKVQRGSSKKIRPKKEW
ncbi:MAG: tetratricopeptide repeat protein [Saprospiraceae bacterium]|nr:tetratricopeptide repeat protein [Saprospiraceae bacterium]